MRAEDALNPRYLQSKLSNLRVLNHELVTVDGLTIFGSCFDPCQSAGGPDRVGDTGMRRGWHVHGAHRYAEIPHGVHILLTHVPARGIFDCCSSRGGQWGSSSDLQKEILKKGCLAHFFGHLHEQRGVWIRSSRHEDFTGGTEFMAHGRPFFTYKPRCTDSSCLLISCNAMVSHPDKDGLKFHMAGPPRLVVAEPSDTPEGVRFRIVKRGSEEYSDTRRWQPSRPLQREPLASSGTLIHKLAKHFRIVPDLVEDVLSELVSDNASRSTEGLEEEAMITLSQMCDAPSDSDYESPAEELLDTHKRQRR
jgi:hypothetical protein